MYLSPITSSSLIERNKLENTSKEYIIKGNIMNVANEDKDFAPPLPLENKILVRIYYDRHREE